MAAARLIAGFAYFDKSKYFVLLFGNSCVQFVVRPFVGIVVLCFAEGVGPTFVVRLAYNAIFGVLAGLNCAFPTCAGQYCPEGWSELAKSVPPLCRQCHTPRRWSVLPAGAC